MKYSSATISPTTTRKSRALTAAIPYHLAGVPIPPVGCARGATEA